MHSLVEGEAQYHLLWYKVKTFDVISPKTFEACTHDRDRVQFDEEHNQHSGVACASLVKEAIRMGVNPLLLVDHALF